MIPANQRFYVANGAMNRVEVFSATLSVGGVAGFPASGPARVAATSAQIVFVGLAGKEEPAPVTIASGK